jgi:FkbH-like protein
MSELRIAILANWTADFLREPLAKALERLGFQPIFWIASFDQYRQAILADNSELYRFEPTIVILNLDGQDLFRDVLRNPFDVSPEKRQSLASERANETAGLVTLLSARIPTASILLNTIFFPPLHSLLGLEFNSEYALYEIPYFYNDHLARLVAPQPSISIVDIASLALLLGFERWYDPRMWYLARMRAGRKALEGMAQRYAAVIGSRLGQIRKCLVLDLDNTLWGGIVGEDGPGGILLGDEGVGLAYAEFQDEIVNLRRKGILLAICSKNNVSDALEVIRSHPSMRLREEHFAAIRINWDDKASNLRSIAAELNIGLDSLVFLDDNPVERSWVREALPAVHVPEWPNDPSEYKTALLELAVEDFFQMTLTDEDRRRAEIYQAQAERQRMAESSTTIDEFYRSLQMQLTIATADSLTIPRIAQLTQKTNQFNLTTRRYTASEITELAQNPGAAVYWLSLVDKFGSSGIVGVMIVRRQPEPEHADTWLIDTFLLSCRVLGRGVEKAFIAFICEDLKRRGARKLLGEYRPTAKNAIVAGIYDDLAFYRTADENVSWALDLDGQFPVIPDWFELPPSKDKIHAESAAVRDNQ